MMTDPGSDPVGCPACRSSSQGQRPFGRRLVAVACQQQHWLGGDWRWGMQQRSGGSGTLQKRDPRQNNHSLDKDGCIAGFRWVTALLTGYPRQLALRTRGTRMKAMG